MSKILPAPLFDMLIRRRFRRALRDLPLDRFEVRIAHTQQEYEDAFRLVGIAYAYRGLNPARASTLRITPQHVLPEATVLVAYEGEHAVGTMTVTLDSDAGLPLDSDYPDALKRLRRDPETRLVEYGSLAVVQRCLHSGVTLLMNIAAHFFSLNVLKATHCAVGLHPRVARWYQAIYAFEKLGEAKDHNHLQAPVQGIVARFDRSLAHFKRYFRRPMATGALPHEHFCERLPECIKLPEVETLDELVRYKLPREVFQQLFVQLSDTLSKLDPQVRQQLQRWRSPRTITCVVLPRAESFGT